MTTMLDLGLLSHHTVPGWGLPGYRLGSHVPRLRPTWRSSALRRHLFGSGVLPGCGVCPPALHHIASPASSRVRSSLSRTCSRTETRSGLPGPVGVRGAFFKRRTSPGRHVSGAPTALRPPTPPSDGGPPPVLCCAPVVYCAPVVMVSPEVEYKVLPLLGCLRNHTKGSGNCESVNSRTPRDESQRPGCTSPTARH